MTSPLPFAGKKGDDEHCFSVGETVIIKNAIYSEVDVGYRGYININAHIGKRATIISLLHGTLVRHVMFVKFINSDGTTGSPFQIPCFMCEKLPSLYFDEKELLFLKRMIECTLENTNSNSLYQYARDLSEKLK